MLSLELVKFLIYQFSSILKKFTSIQTIEVETEEQQQQIILTVYGGNYLYGEHNITIYYAFERGPDETFDDHKLLFFKKKDQPWHCFYLANSNDSCFAIKLTDNGWKRCSLKEQLRLSLGFQEIFDSGLVLQPIQKSIDQNLIFEVLENDFY